MGMEPFINPDNGDKWHWVENIHQAAFEIVFGSPRPAGKLGQLLDNQTARFKGIGTVLSAIYSGVQGRGGSLHTDLPSNVQIDDLIFTEDRFHAWMSLRGWVGGYIASAAYLVDVTPGTFDGPGSRFFLADLKSAATETPSPIAINRVGGGEYEIGGSRYRVQHVKERIRKQIISDFTPIKHFNVRRLIGDLARRGQSAPAVPDEDSKIVDISGPDHSRIFFRSSGPRLHHGPNVDRVVEFWIRNCLGAYYAHAPDITASTSSESWEIVIGEPAQKTIESLSSRVA